MKINSHNEWDELKEIIVGNGESIAPLVFSNSEHVSEKKLADAYELAQQAYPKYFVDEINEDLNELCDVIKDFGAKVFRPNSSDTQKFFSTPNWCAVGSNCFNARDLHLVVGNSVIESPSHEKFRYYEGSSLYDIWYKYFEEGFRWINAPKPRLSGNFKSQIIENGQIQMSTTGLPLTRLAENEILFEAANTVRMGKDLLYLISASGNKLGAKWLQSVLGDEYRVHTTERIYRSSHIDSTVLALKPGTVLLNASRVNSENMPEILKKWDKIMFNDILPFPKEVLDHQRNVRNKIYKQITEMGIETYINDTSSEWIGMNVLSLDPNTVVVDKRQTQLCESLEKNNFDVIRINARHSYFMGGIHCSTLDTVRKSELESYFD